MEPVPSNEPQLTAADDFADGAAMSDKLACDQIEQLVVNALNEIGQYIATAEAADVDRDDLRNNEDHGHDIEVGVESLKTRIAEGLNGIVLSRVRGLLYNDTDITCSAKHYKIDPDFLFIRLDADTAEFYILPDRFEAWLMKHERSISTNFVRKRIYPYNDVDKQVRHTYACQCAGKKALPKGEVKGGASGKPRMRRAGIKNDCPSRIFALFQPLVLADGSSMRVCAVTYLYQHNHSVGDITDLGTRQKSAAIKSTIERLILQGSTIQRVMQQLTMDYDKFTQITRGNGQQLSRDDFITYDDVYNIWYKITTKAMRKDPDP
ncbi:hypothetical protein EDD11_010130, partial [Mortierella claussenii]